MFIVVSACMFDHKPERCLAVERVGHD